jgi:hypothetical protein
MIPNLDLWLIGALAALFIWRIRRERKADREQIRRLRERLYKGNLI